jgi:TPR repeat protein
VKYNNGEGVQQDYVQTHMWYRLAAESYLAAGDDDTSYKTNLHDSQVATRMSQVQIADAQGLAREWLAAHPKT